MERTVALGTGVDLACDDAGEGPPVVLIHGWPETKYSWRHQVPALAGAGYRAIAVDCRGYGGSSKPEAVEAYSLELIVADFIALFDALELPSPVVVGHDWGSIIAWSLAVIHPDRLRAVGSLNVPYRGWATGFPPIEYIREHLADRFGYVLYFQEEGPPEAAFAADPDGWLRRVYDSIAKNPRFLQAADFAVYRDAFVSGGMRPPLNYYRNIDANHAAMTAFENAPVTLPALMVVADSDPVLPASLVVGMERWIEDLTVAPVAEAGHWVQQEQPGRVNQALLEFLSGLP
jgi:pimeloyl-ACP methyl ester carboxylesterase